MDLTYDPPNRNPSKPWRWILIDSLIIGGIAFVASLPTNHLPTLTEVYVGIKAFLYSFLIQLAVERGIKPWKYGRYSKE